MNFFNKLETKDIKNFIKNGYLIFQVRELKKLNILKKNVANIVRKILKKKIVDLDFFHKEINKKNINSIRMKIFNEINNKNIMKYFYYYIFKEKLELLVGNELAMQNQLNLSIQMPNDHTSVLPMHADTFNGESPFEVVAWLPLVDCFKTKSMYFVDPKNSDNMTKKLNIFSVPKKGGMNKVYKLLKNKIKFINIKYGEALIFSPNYFHGNVVNLETSTRFSFNTRFKSILSPYTSEEKTLGKFYQLITMRPATKLGLNFKKPDKFKIE